MLSNAFITVEYGPADDLPFLIAVCVITKNSIGLV